MTKKYLRNREEDLIKIAFLLGVLILLTVGFSLGYIYVNYINKSCNVNPLIYGISELNKINKDKFTCTCISNSGRIKPFTLDEKGFSSEYFYRY